MAFFTPATSLEARDPSDTRTAKAAAAATKRFVTRLLSPDIVVVGCINEDTTVEVLRLPSPGETVLGREIRTSFGGKGANQAVQAALLLPRTRATDAKAEAQGQPASRREDREEEEAGRTEGGGRGGGGATAAAAVEKVTEKATKTAKAAGAGVASVVEGLFAQISSKKESASATAVEEEAQVVEEGEQLLLEKMPAGGKVALICKLGDDEAGVRYRKYLAEKCIEQEGIFTAIKGKPTGRAFITVSVEDGGENTIAYVPGANEHLTQSDILQPHIVRLLQQAKVVVCENGVSGSVIVEALRLAKAAPEEVLTIFSPAPVARVPREAFAYADYVVVNTVEAQQLYEQLVPLPRVRDSAGHVYEDVHQEEIRRQRESEWPSLYATAAAKPPRKAREGEERGGPAAAGGAAAAGEAAAVVTDTVPPPLALRERLKAVGTYAVEIQPAATATETPVNAAAVVAGRTEEVRDKARERLVADAGHKMRETGAAATQSDSRGGAGLPTAAAADLEEAAAEGEKRREGGQGGDTRGVLPETKEKECFSRGVVGQAPRRGKCEIVITAGPRGCTITDRGQVLQTPPQRVVQQHEVVDTVGAGDAFVGALAYFLGLEKRNVKEAVEKAGIVASYSTTRKGASASYTDRCALGEDFFKS